MKIKEAGDVRSGHSHLIIETTIQALHPGMVVEKELQAVGSL